MKLIDWLKITDILGLTVVVWSKDQIEYDEDEPLWAGSSLDIPWYIAGMKIAKRLEDDEQPISYRDSLGPQYNNKRGFVIIVEEDK